MSGAILDAEELAAVRGAIGRAVAASATKQAAVSAQREAVAVALIADDAAGERACPDGVKLAVRGTQLARQRLIRGAQVKLELNVAGADVLHQTMLRDELPTAYHAVLEIEGRSDPALLVITGPMIEWVAAKLLGAPEEDSTNSDREPSATALRVFARAGDLVVAAMVEAWRIEQGATVHVIEEPNKRDALRRMVLEADILVSVSMIASGPTTGSIRLIAPPAAVVAPAPTVKIGGGSTDVLATALGEVPVEVRVELGRARMTASELSHLSKGTLITLQQAIDDLLPISCGGVVKAHGRPVVHKGAMAVEVVAAPARNPSQSNQQAPTPPTSLIAPPPVTGVAPVTAVAAGSKA